MAVKVYADKDYVANYVEENGGGKAIFSTEDLVAGESELETGTFYYVYEE